MRWSVHIITISVCNNDHDGEYDVDCDDLLIDKQDDNIGGKEDVDLKSDELLVDEEVVDLPDVDPQLHLDIQNVDDNYLRSWP